MKALLKMLIFNDTFNIDEFEIMNGCDSFFGSFSRIEFKKTPFLFSLSYYVDFYNLCQHCDPITRMNDIVDPRLCNSGEHLSNHDGIINTISTNSTNVLIACFEKNGNSPLDALMFAVETEQFLEKVKNAIWKTTDNVHGNYNHSVWVTKDAELISKDFEIFKKNLIQEVKLSH